MRKSVASIDPAVPRCQSLTESGPGGLWRSPGGSLYVCDGVRFVCVCVHAAQWRGWLNKTAVRLLPSEGSDRRALQAFRDSITGELIGWELIRLAVTRDTVTKHFPAHLPRETLAYGYVERYERVRPLHRHRAYNRRPQ